MPRLIPRLLQGLQNAPSRRPLLKVTRPPPRKITCLSSPPDRPDISPEGRTKSILLERHNLNLILRAKRYRRHKSLAPKVRIPKRWTAQRRGSLMVGELPREMTLEERVWWANPYLRMLSSPLRKCFETEQMLPRDFLLRLSAMRVKTPRLGKPAQALFPDGLEHPAFSGHKAGVGHYIICWKDAFKQLQERGSYRRLSSNVFMHSLLELQIGHLLRVRVLQELKILADRLQRSPKALEYTPSLRRLTRVEWNNVKSSGVIPYENAVAVLVVPPLNKNRETKQRPKPSFSATPTAEDLEVAKDLPPPPPVSVLHPTVNPDALEEVEDVPNLLPHSKVPLYNGVALFPSRPQRAALHSALLRILDLEYQKAPKDKKAERGHGEQKGSHAFLLCSDAATVLRVDTVPLAIALWRVRMWEGGGREDSADPTGGWTFKRW